MLDEEIIELFFTRSEDAIKELKVKYGKICLQTSYNILDNYFDAEECVNDSYLGVWNAIPPTRPKPLLTYVLKIVRNVSLTRYQKNHAQKRSSSYDVAMEELEEFLAAPDSVESTLETSELTAAIESFLDLQKPLNRVIFVRRYWYLDSVADISKRYALSESKIKTTLFRCRNQLREYLEKEGYTL